MAKKKVTAKKPAAKKKAAKTPATKKPARQTPARTPAAKKRSTKHKRGYSTSASVRNEIIAAEKDLAIVQLYLQGFRPVEIAQRTGQSRRAVRLSIQRTRERWRDEAMDACQMAAHRVVETARPF